MKNEKNVAGILIIVGTAFVIGALYYFITPNASEESGSLLKTIGAIIVFFSGLGSSIKGWKDLFAPEKPSSSGTTINSSGDNSQINTGKHGKNIKTETYIENVENYLQPEKPFSSLFSLPTPPADFTGRGSELEAIKAELSRGGAAAISGLSGMGGVGKTVLGLKAAQDLRHLFPDAQIYIEMKGTTEPIAPEEALREIILAFDPTADLRAASSAQLRALYLSLLQEKKALLFFDNALDAMQVKPLIEGIPCAALVTSRRHFALPGLKPTRLDVMSPEDARNLLLELAPRTDKNADALAKLCGYLPLALRIAGNFLAMNENWTVAEYLEKLSDERSRLSTFRSPDDPDLNVEAAIQLSYAQLDESTQSHWRKLSVFPAPFDQSAAAAVLELTESETRVLLDQLRRFSFIFFEEGQGKYYLHDLLRDFASKEIQPEGKLSASFNHAIYYKELASYANKLYLQGGENILKGLALFDAHWLHVQASYSWVVKEAKRYHMEAIILSSEYVANCHLILPIRLPPEKYLLWLKEALDSSIKVENTQHQTWHLGNLGGAYSVLGRRKEALQCYKDALELSQQIGDKRSEGINLASMGDFYSSAGELNAALEYYDQALHIFRKTRRKGDEGAVLSNLGLVHANLNNTEKAVELYHQALSINRENGDKVQEAKTLLLLGQVHLSSLNNNKLAEIFFAHGLKLFRELGDMRGETSAQVSLGTLAYISHQDEQALEFYNAAMRKAINMKAKPLVAYITLLRAPLVGQIFSKEEGIRLIKDATLAYKEMDMLGALDQERIKDLLAMFADGKFPT